MEAASSGIGSSMTGRFYIGNWQPISQRFRPNLASNGNTLYHPCILAQPARGDWTPCRLQSDVTIVTQVGKSGEKGITAAEHLVYPAADTHLHPLHLGLSPMVHAHIKGLQNAWSQHDRKNVHVSHFTGKTGRSVNSKQPCKDAPLFVDSRLMNSWSQHSTHLVSHLERSIKLAEQKVHLKHPPTGSTASWHALLLQPK